MKKIKFLYICLAITLLLSGCIGKNAKHISQAEAQEIANGLTGEEVTYVETKELKKEKQTIYVFTDSRDNTFCIFSCLYQKNFDGLSYGPYLCKVFDSYQVGVFHAHEDEVKQIIDKYGITGYLSEEHVFEEDPYNYMSCIAGSLDLEIEHGTPEENRDVLKNIAAAMAEIDALLGMNYDVSYEDKTEDEYYYYRGTTHTSRLGMHITFRNVPNEEKGTYSSDMATSDFSLSKEERWTADILYEALKDELDEVKIAE